MSLIDPDVRARWCAFTASFEGRKTWMYQDVRGLMTTGLGCLIDPVARALELPWRVAGGDLADPGHVCAEWWAVKSMKPAMVAEAYREPGGLRLTEDDVDRLALERLDAEAALLAATWTGFPSFPPEAQQALLSMAWGLGAGATRPGLLSPEWPRLQAAVAAGDWAAAAAECAMASAGTTQRNAANKALFLAAAAR